MHPVLGGEAAFTPNLPQIQDMLVGRGTIRSPLPLDSVLKDLHPNDAAAVAVAYTSVQHWASLAVFPVGCVYTANVEVLPLKAPQSQIFPCRADKSVLFRFILEILPPKFRLAGCPACRLGGMQPDAHGLNHTGVIGASCRFGPSWPEVTGARNGGFFVPENKTKKRR